MKTATNLSPIETIEEGTYNFLTVVSISLFVSAVLIFGHLLIYHGLLSYLFLSLGSIGLIGSILFPYLKRKRFKNKNYTLAERIVRVEGVLGEHIPKEN